MTAVRPSLAPIERRTLDNGLRVVLQSDRALPLVALNIWYDVGSRDESPGRTGLAHLFEHMLFQGSRHVDTNEHFRRIQEVGGVANGSTWYDRTNYYETLPAHHLELGLWLESDRMGFWLDALDDDKLETQRQVVLNERRQRVDNRPYGRAFERLHELLYPPAHPYHWPVIGYADDIAAATRADVEAFFRRHYVPDNAVLSLVGDFEVDAAARAVEAWFGEIPAGAAERGAVPELEPLTGESRESMADDVELSRVYLGYRCPPLGTPDWYAADLLASVLAGGKSSPLWSDLVHQRQLAQDVSAFALPTELASTFSVVATARPGLEPERLERALDEHLERAARGIDAGDLERAKNQLVTSMCEELQSFERRADLLSFLTTRFDEPERLATEIERYLELGAADLAAVAERHLARERRVALTVTPRSTE